VQSSKNITLSGRLVSGLVRTKFETERLKTLTESIDHLTSFHFRIPANCAFTGCDRTAGTINPPSITKRDYFNSGLVVLIPNQDIFQQMIDRLFGAADLSIYPFPDQDFLNEIFKNRWKPLPYSYNALKTLPSAHSPMWNLHDVKNIHYILSKPWDTDPNHEPDVYYPLYQLWWEAFNSLPTSMK
jgi:alpha-N-acetylglucosamine transferase